MVAGIDDGAEEAALAGRPGGHAVQVGGPADQHQVRTFQRADVRFLGPDHVGVTVLPCHRDQLLRHQPVLP